VMISLLLIPIYSKKALKKMDNLMYVIENTPHQNLPNSYKRIKKVLLERIKKYC
jgi:hypothetical protein